MQLCLYSNVLFHSTFRLATMNAKVPISLGLIGILLLMFPPLFYAHPHVFIENRLTIVFDSKGLAGIEVKWVFDEFFSNMIVTDYDQNRNHKLENAEIKNY